jgi:hypothetical protein
MQFHLVYVYQVSDNVEFHTTIVGNNLGGISLAVNDNFLGRNIFDKIALVGIFKLIRTNGSSKRVGLVVVL